MKIALIGASSIKSIKNFGDLLLADIYESWIRQAVPDADVRRVEYRGLGKSRWSVRNMAQWADCIVFNGGGYFSEKPFEGSNIVKKLMLKQAWGVRNYDLYGEMLHAARRFGKPILASGIEVGPITSPLLRRVVRSLFTYSCFSSVRNNDSREYLGQLGCCTENIRVAPDSALSIQRRTSTEGLARTHSALGPLRIGLHLHKLKEYNEAKIVADIIHAVVKASDCTVCEVVYLHDQTKQDVIPVRSIRAEHQLRQCLPRLQTILFTSPANLISELHTCHLLLTTKLHCGIVARAIGTPVLAIPSHPKTSRFYDYIGERFRCTRFQELAYNGLPEGILHEVNLGLRGTWSNINESLITALRSLRSEFRSAVRTLASRPQS
jgi:polysaccharide pyruvyl transferase WcaK-like protein